MKTVLRLGDFVSSDRLMRLREAKHLIEQDVVRRDEWVKWRKLHRALFMEAGKPRIRKLTKWTVTWKWGSRRQQYKTFDAASRCAKRWWEREWQEWKT